MFGIRRIHEDIRQARPFATRSEEAIVALLRTADVLRRLLGEVVEARGVTLQQYNVLRILRGAGERGLPTLEIGLRMIERSPGVTRLLDRLEAKSLVRRERCLADRRQVFCWIAPAGLDLLAALEEPLRRTSNGALAGLAEGDLEHLISSLDVIRATEAPTPLT